MEKKLKDMGVELNELAIAMCDYIQTGQKTEQLSKFWDNEDSIGATHRMGVGECHTTYWFLIYSCTICKLFSLTVVTK